LSSLHVILRFFNKSFTHTSGTMQLIACLGILKRSCRLTYESPLAKKRSVSASLYWTEMVFLYEVSFFEIFSQNKLIKNSNSLGDILVKFLYNPLTDWKFKSDSKLEPLYTPCWCTVAFATTADLCSFSLKRNVYKCTKPLLAANTPLGSRNKLGTPRCNARRILLRREALDESSARNSVSCQSLATLRRYGTR